MRADAFPFLMRDGIISELIYPLLHLLFAYFG